MMRPTLVALIALAPTAGLAGNVHVTVKNDLRCITSDGLPDHTTGRFPTRRNPNTIQRQTIRFCVDATPEYSGKAQQVQATGVATNGIIIRPGTADWYDASAPRGHSRNSASGWRLDAMGAPNRLGLDDNNAHVDHRGLYHYHGIAQPLADDPGTLIGWAADGFEIHYAGDQVQSSYRLKSGTRPTAPGGAFDGTYVQDWAYVKGAGDLDECNGAMVNGTYTYFATDGFPFFPHCLKGKQIMRQR